MNGFSITYFLIQHHWRQVWFWHEPIIFVSFLWPYQDSFSWFDMKGSSFLKCGIGVFWHGLGLSNGFIFRCLLYLSKGIEILDLDSVLGIRTKATDMFHGLNGNIQVHPQGSLFHSSIASPNVLEQLSQCFHGFHCLFRGSNIWIHDNFHQRTACPIKVHQGPSSFSSIFFGKKCRCGCFAGILLQLYSINANSDGLKSLLLLWCFVWDLLSYVRG